LDYVLRRRRWIIHRRLESWKIKEIADALRINEKTADRWLSVHRKLGWEGLNIKSRRPHRHYRMSQSTVSLILELRRSKHWGPCKIEGYLKNYRLEGITPVSHRTIHRILVKAELNNPISTPRRVWDKRRFQREHSNSLWQADYKLTSQDEWMISYLDDH
jgi:transposase